MYAIATTVKVIIMIVATMYVFDDIHNDDGDVGYEDNNGEHDDNDSDEDGDDIVDYNRWYQTGRRNERIRGPVGGLCGRSVVQCVW